MSVPLPGQRIRRRRVGLPDQHVRLSVAGTFLAVFLGTLGRLCLLALQFRRQGDFMFFVLSTRMLPPVAVLVFYHLMFARLGLADTRIGLILIVIFINVGLATWIMKGFFDGVPKEVEQIAIVNGYTRMYAFTRLVLPMVKGGIAATAGFCFIFAWNEFAFCLDPDDDAGQDIAGQDLFGRRRHRHRVDADLRRRRRTHHPRADLLLADPQASADGHDLRRPGGGGEAHDCPASRRQRSRQANCASAHPDA